MDSQINKVEKQLEENGLLPNETLFVYSLLVGK